jgi:hypothetical protein
VAQGPGGPPGAAAHEIQQESRRFGTPLTEGLLYNDLHPATMTLQLFQATSLVVGRAGTELDRHQVFIVVPSNSCTAPG